MEEILHQLIGSLHHYLQGLIHPRWCRISSINSRMSCWNFRSTVSNYRNPFHFTSGWKKPVRKPFINVLGLPSTPLHRLRYIFKNMAVFKRYGPSRKWMVEILNTVPNLLFQTATSYSYQIFVIEPPMFRPNRLEIWIFANRPSSKCFETPTETCCKTLECL